MGQGYAFSVIGYRAKHAAPEPDGKRSGDFFPPDLFAQAQTSASPKQQGTVSHTVAVRSSTNP